MELRISDTSYPQIIEFYIYAQKKNNPTIFAITPNKAVISIVCGNEVVSVSFQYQDLGSFIPDGSTETISVGNKFNSDIAGCPITKLRLCLD
jgi:hypothetical protein